MVSIQVAGKQIKKPIDIPRPGKKKKGQSPRQQAPAVPAGREVQESPQKATPPPSDASRDAAFKQGVSVLMGSARVRGR